MKKFLIILLIASMLIMSMPIAYSGEVNSNYFYALKLSKIGVLKGTTNGYELNRELTRLEGLVILIRLLGKEDVVQSLSENEVSLFSDVVGWGVRYTNYAYRNGLTKGLGNGIFGPNDIMKSKDYHTLLLRALDYSDAECDFSWENSDEFLLEKGIVSQNYYHRVVDGKFLRGDVAESSYKALHSQKKSSGDTLLLSLLRSGDISSDIAIEMEELNELTVMSYTYNNGLLRILRDDASSELNLEFKRCGINSIFSIYSISMSDKNSKMVIGSCTDWIGPYITEYIGSECIKNLKEEFTGGWHGEGLNNKLSTAYTKSVKIYANSIEIVGNCEVDTSDNIRIVVVNSIEAYNSDESCIEETVTYEIYNSNIDVNVSVKALEDISIHRYYGLQSQNSVWTNTRYVVNGMESNDYLVNTNSNSGNSQVCREYLLSSGKHPFQLKVWLADEGLGSFSNKDSKLPYAFALNYGKSYFNLINNSNLELKKGEDFLWKGGYIFGVNIN